MTTATEYSSAEKMVGTFIRCEVKPPRGKPYVIEGTVKRWRPADLRSDGKRLPGSCSFLVRSEDGINRWTPAVAPVAE